MALKNITISDIKIGDRFREDLGDINLLIESIKDKGVIQPITVDNDLNLLAGGRRVAASIEAGLTKIPALVRKVTGEIDAREIELIENVIRKDMEWHERAALVQRIDNLQIEKFGSETKSKTAQILDKSSGWVTRQLQVAEALEVMPELKNCKTEDEAVKLLKKTEEDVVVKELRRRQDEEIKIKHSGDFLKIAASNYRVGDTFEGLSELIKIGKKMKGAGTFDLIEVDPPYGIDLEDAKKGDASSELEKYTEVDKEDYPTFLQGLCNNLYQVAARDSWVIFWYGPTWHTEIFHALRYAGFEVDDIPAIWTKGTGQTMAPNLYLARCYEPFAIARKGNPQIIKRGRSNIFNVSPVPPTEKYHPTQRPLDLMTEVISTFANPSAKVLIPFLGSGVSLRACYKMKMKGLGFDLDENNRDRFLLQVQEDIENGLYESE